MPAPINNRVGALASQLSAGGGSLVPVSQDLEIEEDECGLMVCEREYLLWNNNYPALRPARGAVPVNPPDMNIDFLGAHASRFRRNAHAPGVGILAVTYKGAKFS